jgi:hypothetical protein
VSIEAQIINFMCKNGAQLYQNRLKIDREVQVLEAGDTASGKL